MKIWNMVVCLVFTLGTETTLAVLDPVKDFLELPPPYVREHGKYYSDDLLLRLNLDLNNDGNIETLLSLARDRDGKQGNIWALYETNNKEFIKIGSITFNPSRFYLGPLGGEKYGLATFGPAGAGEGIMWGYIFDGPHIDSIKLGEVVLNRQTMKLEGGEIINKYLGDKAVIGEKIVQIIGSKELAEKYGVKVDPRTYRVALEEEMRASHNVSMPTAVASTQSMPVPPMTRQVEQAESKAQANPSPKVPEPQSAPWPWIVGAIFLLAVAGGVLFKCLHK
jgi:hypothetical protein